jgi:hypothetical protein
MKRLSAFLKVPERDEYFKLVARYSCREVRGYSESHHIVPRALGGEDVPDNLVRVPARVHYRLHQLLPSLCKTRVARNKMLAALWRMSVPQTHKHKRKTTCKEYSEARELWAAEMSSRNPMHDPEVLASVLGVKRPEQREVMRAVNEKRWAKVAIKVVCTECGTKHVLRLTKYRAARLRPDWCCSRSCYSYQTLANESVDTKRKRAVGRLREAEKKTGRPAWNKGKTNPLSAENGRIGAVALSKRVTGRRMATRADGSRYWVYSDAQFRAAA